MPPKSLRTTTIRQSLLRNLFVLIAFTSGTIVVATLVARHEAMSTFSERLLTHTVDRTEIVLEGLFEPVENGLRVARQWGRQGLLDISDPQSLNALFVPYLEAYPQISSMMIGNTQGNEWMLLRTETGWSNRLTRRGEWGDRTRWFDWDREGKRMIREYWKELDYDPRNRPWFRLAIDRARTGQVVWTPPYIFYTTKDPGITASIRWHPPGSSTPEYVIGFDVKLLNIAQFTTSYQVGQQGCAMVFTDDGRVVGLPGRSGFEETERLKASVLKTGEELHHPLIRSALKVWESGQPTQPVSFKMQNRKWWCTFRPFYLTNQTFWIGVFVPAAEFTADADKRLAVALITAALSVLLALIIAARLARTYSRPLEKLALGTRRIRDLDLLFEPDVETPIREMNELAQAHTQMLSALQSFSRYVPIEVVRELVRRGEVAEIGGEMESLTILFMDIRGFTSIAEEMHPTALTRQMSEYFEAMITILHRTEATVDKFIGDAILAFWGAPRRDARHAEHGVEAALRCSRELGSFNRAWIERGLPPLPTCFGLDTGTVIVGNIGAPSRLGYTVLGDTVNLASRLEALNRVYGTSVLASDTLQKQTSEIFEWRLVDRVAVKGRKRPVSVFEPLGRQGEVDPDRIRFARDYEEAFSLYQSRLFEEAIRSLRELNNIPPGDRSVDRLVRICRTLIDSPPSEDWDGVVRFEVK